MPASYHRTQSVAVRKTLLWVRTSSSCRLAYGPATVDEQGLPGDVARRI